MPGPPLCASRCAPGGVDYNPDLYCCDKFDGVCNPETQKYSCKVGAARSMVACIAI